MLKKTFFYFFRVLIVSIIFSSPAMAAENIYILARGGGFGSTINNLIAYLATAGHTVTQSPFNATFPPAATLAGQDQVWIFGTSPNISAAEITNINDYLATGGAVFLNGEFQPADLAAMQLIINGSLTPALSATMVATLYTGAPSKPAILNPDLRGGISCLNTVNTNTSAYGHITNVPLENQVLYASAMPNNETVNAFFSGTDLIAGSGALMIGGDHGLYSSAGITKTDVVDMMVTVLANGRLSGGACPALIQNVSVPSQGLLLLCAMLVAVGCIGRAKQYQQTLKNALI